MATKKFKVPAGMNPIDAADFAKYGSFVHGEPFDVGDVTWTDAKGNRVNPADMWNKTKSKSKVKAKPKKKPTKKKSK